MTFLTRYQYSWLSLGKNHKEYGLVIWANGKLYLKKIWELNSFTDSDTKELFNHFEYRFVKLDIKVHDSHIIKLIKHIKEKIKKSLTIENRLSDKQSKNEDTRKLFNIKRLLVSWDQISPKKTIKWNTQIEELADLFCIESKEFEIIDATGKNIILKWYSHILEITNFSNPVQINSSSIKFITEYFYEDFPHEIKIFDVWDFLKNSRIRYFLNDMPKEQNNICIKWKLFLDLVRHWKISIQLYSKLTDDNKFK